MRTDRQSLPRSRLEIEFASAADLSMANSVLRCIAYRIDPSQSAVPATEAQFETVTFRVMAGEGMATLPEQELPAIEIQVMPAADFAGATDGDVAAR